MRTVNISLPTSMYEDAKKVMTKKHYASLSELMRDALRSILYPHLTVNGFTPEFEEQVLKAATSPDIDDVWTTDEDVHRFFENLRQEIRAEKKKEKNGKS